MNQWLALVQMFLYGALGGALYLYGLWLTVQRVRHGGYSAVWLLASGVARVVFLLFFLYCILGGGHWQHLLAALGGFITLRILVTRTIRQTGPVVDGKGGRAI